MTKDKPSFIGYYWMFVGVGLAVAVVVAGLGAIPTIRLAGVDGIKGLAAGCLVSWIATCVGALPVSLSLASHPKEAATAVLTATMVRFIAALALVVPLVLSGWFDRKILVLFVAISYMLMLLVDTLLAVRVIRRAEGLWN